MIKVNSVDIEIAVAELIDSRRNTIVPNVSWGLGLGHECDLLILDKKNRFTEVEIKISRQDLKKDMIKQHGHQSAMISRLVYAVYEPVLELAEEILPARVGIIAVKYSEPRKRFVARWVRTVKHDNKKAAVTEEKIRKFLELGCMRIWSLKTKLIKLSRENNHLNKSK